MTDIEGFLTIYGHSDNLLNILFAASLEVEVWSRLTAFKLSSRNLRKDFLLLSRLAKRENTPLTVGIKPNSSLQAVKYCNKNIPQEREEQLYTAFSGISVKRDPSHTILCLCANTPGSKNKGSVPQKVRIFEPKEGRVAVYFRRTSFCSLTYKFKWRVTSDEKGNVTGSACAACLCFFLVVVFFFLVWPMQFSLMLESTGVGELYRKHWCRNIVSSHCFLFCLYLSFK